MFSRSLLNWLESNLVSIVLAGLLSLTVWIVATQEANPVEEIDFDRPIPISTIDPPPGLIITSGLPETAHVRVRAARNTWRSLSVEDFSVVADFSHLGPGTHEVPLQASVDAQAILVEVRPASVRVEIEEARQRELPVQLVTEGELPTGYRAGRATIDPSTATVRGPRSKVELVSEVVASISLDGLRDAVEQTVALAALDSAGEPVEQVTVMPSSVAITIPIVQQADFREVAVRVNTSVRPAPGYYISRITPDPPLVPVRGDPDALRSLTVIETEPISLQGLKETTSVIVRLQPPSGVTLEDIQTVEVSIVVQAQPDFRVIEVPIQPVGLEEGLVADVLPSSAIVSLSGPLPILEGLNEQEDIIVSVNLADLEVGSFQVEPEVEIVSKDIPAEDLQQVVVESVLPTEVEVEIRTAGAAGTR